MDEKHFLDELSKIVHLATKKGTIIRGLGASAIRSHSHGFADKCPVIKRQLTDLDFITYFKQESRIMEVFSECNYHQDRNRAYIRNLLGRSLLENSDTGLIVDLYFDVLDYNHKIDLRGRLEKDSLTIPLADLVLQKTQIVQINEKDVKDMILLLREHPLGNNDKETVNTSRICDVLAKDWGFYYTVTNNLDKISVYAKNLKELENEDRLDVLSKLDSLKQEIEDYPKSFGWKMRAKIGPKKKWYNDVEDMYVGH